MIGDVFFRGKELSCFCSVARVVLQTDNDRKLGAIDFFVYFSPQKQSTSDHSLLCK